MFFVLIGNRPIIGLSIIGQCFIGALLLSTLPTNMGH